MKKAFSLLLVALLSLSLCIPASAVLTEQFYFNDSYDDGLPEGYSGAGYWIEDEKICEIKGTGTSETETTQMNREFSIKGEEVTFSATFIWTGTANMQVVFYDEKTEFLHLQLRPNTRVGSNFIFARGSGSGGYTEVCKQSKNYEAGKEYQFEIKIRSEKPQKAEIRFTDNNGNWLAWDTVPITASFTKITKQTWIYAGVSEGSSTKIKRLAASWTEDILNDKEAVDYVKNSLCLGSLDNISADMSLPTTGAYGTSISWTSDSPYLTETGAYTAPSEETTVNLIATISRGEETASKSFSATLYGTEASKARKDMDSIFLSSLSRVTEKLDLPTIGENGSVISWASDKPSVIAADGSVTRGETEEKVLLSATVTYGGASVTRDFTATVPAKTAQSEETGEKICERDIYNGSLSSAYTVSNCGVVNDSLLLYRANETEQVSLQKRFDPHTGHIAYAEMEFVLQGESDKIVQAKLYGSSDTASGQIEIFSVRFRIGKGIFLKGASDSEYAKLGDNLMKAGEKQKIRWEINLYTKTFDTYLNGVCIDSKRSMDERLCDVSKIEFPAVADQSPSGIVIHRLETGYRKNFKEMLRIDAEEISVPTETKENISVASLGKHYRSDVSWTSNHSAARYENGVFYITRPLCSESDVTAVLTATLKNGGFTEEKQFSLKIPRELSTEEALDAAEEELTETLVRNMNKSLSAVTSDLSLPTKLGEGVEIAWTSSDAAVVSTAGKVERRFFAGASKTVVLTATLSKNGETRTKAFNAVVVNSGYESLLDGKTLSASSVDGSYLAVYATDSNPNTSWRPKSGEERPYLKVDLGSLQWINRATVLTSGGAGYTLKISENGSDRKTVAAGSGEELVFTPVRARYVILELSGNHPERGVSEFGIYTLYNDELCVTLDSAALSFQAASAVTENLSLPTEKGEYGSSVVWSSGNTAVIANDGTVTRPKYDTSVTLSAIVSKGAASKTLSYSLTVSGTDGKPNDGRGSGGSYVGSQRPSSGGTLLPAAPSDSQTAAAEAVSVFRDLPQGHWAENAVLSLYGKNILKGDSDGLFYPERKVTRAEFANMLFAALRLPEGTAEFADVSEDAWYAKAVCSLASVGMIRGFEDGSFCPNETISRQDMAVMLDRAVSFAAVLLPTGEEISFDDADAIADYARQGVARMTTAGLLRGMGNNTFSPLAAATRAQSAQMIYELLKCRGEIG